MAVVRQQTLKKLAAPNMENQPLCINIDNNVNFDLKSGFIHLLPIFNGLAGEDPHTHLKEFHMVKACSTCFLQGHASDMCPTMQEDYIGQSNAVDGAFSGQPQRNKVKYSQLGEANGASSFKCGEIGSTNKWKIALLSIESKREC
ncbi:hypothetical protein D5086_017210 [Populus alba]|uniref:Uncharacterized protein n=1 Tax=Populus alba TaxID=43335 RepID=A0ACC4BW48_POPAL